MLDVFLRKYPFSSDYFLFADGDDDEDGEDGDNEDPKGGGKGGGSGGGDETKDWKAEAEKWQGLARKHEKAANAGKDAITRLKEIEDADKTESQKLQEKITASETSLAEAQLELARIRVAIRHGLTESQAKRLVGKTEEELEADAKEFLKDIKPGGSGDNTDRQRRTPRENMRRGNSGSGDDPEEDSDPRKLAGAITRR